MAIVDARIAPVAPVAGERSFRERARYVLRALGCLRPYAPLVAGAYAAVLVNTALGVWMPLVVRHIVNAGIGARVAGAITSGCALLLGLALVQGLATFLVGRWTETASQNVAFDLRNRFHGKLQALSFSFHDQAETGQLLARSVSDIDRLRFLTGRAFLHIVQMSALTLGICTAMLCLEWRLGLLTLATVPFFVLGGLGLGSVLRPLSSRIRNQEAMLTAFLEQNLRGARVVKAFGREPEQIEGFHRHNVGLLELQRQEAGWRALYLPFMQFLAGLGTLLVLVAGGRMVARGSLTLGDLVAFTAYLGLLVGPCRRLGWIIAAIAEASASAERIFEVLDLHAEVRDAPDARPLAACRGAIAFDHVSFGYTHSNRILDDVSFEIRPGEKVALLGATGSGKTSVVNLIPRFYDPLAGSIRLDGTDIRGVTLKSLRDTVGIVLQDALLFASTVRENIAFGRPEAAMADIVAAARAAHAHDFIMALPAGYDTHIGEKGATLSGGQRQRLALARAILKDPPILILDDATSSVDTETEHLVQQTLARLMQGRTAIIIAQRLSTIREAEKILLLHHGRLAAVGVRTADETAHEYLLRTSGLYADLYGQGKTPAAAAEPGPARDWADRSREDL